MQDLQEVTQEVHYENYRSERLAKGAPVPPRRQTLVFNIFFIFSKNYSQFNIYFSFQQSR